YQAETPMSVLLKHINEPMPPIDEFRDNVPAAVQDVVDRSTAKDPDDRYSSALDMARAFAEAVRGGRATEVSRPTKHDHDRTLVENVTPLRNQGGTVTGSRPVTAT